MLPEILTDIPGPKSLSLANRLARVESQNVTFANSDWPIFWESAAGTNVWDVDGNRFLDLTSAFAVSGLGHSNPAVVEALKNQADLLLHGMGDVHPAEVKVALCEQLSAITFERWGAGTGKVILCNAGFEAVEAALKTAHLRTGGKPRIITFAGGYHGLGYGTLMAGGMAKFRAPFREQLGELAIELPFPSCEEDMVALEAALTLALNNNDVSAILVEPILGRGGKVVPPAGFLPLLRRAADESGAVLVLDEIYTGFNRTGRLFACEHSAVVPDIICLGKALASGFPLSACVGKAEVMDAWPASDGEALHTTTSLGNPLGCRMALAAIEQHRDPSVANNVIATSERFRSALEAIDSPRRGKVRGTGLMLGLEIIDPTTGAPDGNLATSIILNSLKDGIILLADGPAGHVLALAPPFAISDEEIAFLCQRLREYSVG
ncbi:MAG: aspartate aminotransferase family protein [Verrucomicrobiae bacterium]|nr:aspartate aminotransferase family protein [Verrucomicrobiae bacterium]